MSSSGYCSDMVFLSTCAICVVKALRRFQRRMVYGVVTGGVARKKRGLCRRLYSVNPSGFRRCVGAICRRNVVKKPDFTVRYHDHVNVHDCGRSA